jgi:hypothetical protein
MKRNINYIGIFLIAYLIFANYREEITSGELGIISFLYYIFDVLCKIKDEVSK